MNYLYFYLHINLFNNLLFLSPRAMPASAEMYDRVWKFNTDTILDVNVSTYGENYVDVQTQKHNISLKSISFCFRFTFKTLYTQCLFHEGAVHIQFRPTQRHGFLSINEIYHMFKVPFDSIPKLWYHVCVTYNGDGRKGSQILMTLNNLVVINKFLENFEDYSMEVFIQRRTWQIGYCRDANWIISPLNVIFRGNVVDFNVWSRPLDLNEMLQFTSDCKDVVGNKMNKSERSDLIIWSDVKIVRRGLNTKLEDRNLPQFTSLCKNNEQSHTLAFVEGYDFSDAELRCTTLGGSMPYPKRQNHLENLIKLGHATIEECNRYWLPIKQHHIQGRKEKYEWIYEKNQSSELVDYLPWRLGEPNGLDIEQCIVVDLRTGLYSDVMCNPTDESKYCFFCSFTGLVHFILRGLPKSCAINDHYVFIPQKQNKYTNRSYSLKLDGYLDYDIKWNRNSKFWHIETPSNNEIAVLNDYNGSPFGKKMWNMSSNCGGSTLLKLSMVRKILY